MNVQRFDALVIGGGPGGLTAALYLARFRRSVLVVDEGRSRAATIPCSHNVVGFPDGIAGAQLVASMRRHAERYGAAFATGRVESIEHTPQGFGFSARWSGGAAQGRIAVLATGASDIEPDMPHVAEALRAGALRYCPVCDGYEVIGQSVGLLADSVRDVDEALFLRHFTDRITIFVVTPNVRYSDRQQRQLDAAGIRTVHEPVSAIRLSNGSVTLRHGDTRTECDALYGALGLKVHSELATALGARADKHGCLWVDEHYQTSIEGLYAVGDVAQGLNQINVAAGGAAIAAAAMHHKLGI